MDFTEVMARVDREDGRKVDAIVHTGAHVAVRLRETRDTHRVPSAGAPAPPDGSPQLCTDGVEGLEGQWLDISPLAHRQIAGRTGVPWKYYERMLERQPQLLAHNLHTWWTTEPENRLMRTLRGDNGSAPVVRAWLSDRYRVLDNRPFLEAALTETEEAGGVISAAHIDDDRLYVKVVTPAVRDIPNRAPGDALQAGLLLRNSEVGDGRYTVQPFIVRLICTNGMVMTERLAGTHLGSQMDLGILADDTIAADNAAILLQVRDWTRAVLRPAYLEEAAALYGRATAVPVRSPATSAVANIVRHHSLSPPEGQGVLERYLRGNEDTQFGVVNAVTAYAHEGVGDFRRQVELEQLAGTLLELEDAAFRRLVGGHLGEREVASALYGRN